MPTVSLIVTTYNQPEFLRIAHQSIFRQTRPLPTEVIPRRGSTRSEARRPKKKKSVAGSD